jgi:hypothetical protein
MPLDTRSFGYAVLWAKAGQKLHGGQWTVRRDGDRFLVIPPAARKQHTKV